MFSSNHLGPTCKLQLILNKLSATDHMQTLSIMFRLFTVSKYHAEGLGALPCSSLFASVFWFSHSGFRGCLDSVEWNGGME